MSEPLLEAEDLTIKYGTERGEVTAVSDASFSIEDGQYMGLVGESGCGKSTVAKAIVGGLDPNGQITSGKLRYRGEEIQHLSEPELNEQIRWKEISWIPQSSMNSLDPLEKISDKAIGIAQIHTDMTKDEALSQFSYMLEIVGIQEDRMHDYPHELSGGMQQRVIIALALFLDPSLIIADEPTTALDVIMQDQVFKYLDNIRKNIGASMMLITHDISLVFESCDKLAVMHSGQVAEEGSTNDVFEAPHHPYTILLKETFPDIRYPDRDLETIEGHPPETLGQVDYCTFVDRCPIATDKCGMTAPKLEKVNGNHHAACFNKQEAYEFYQSKEQGIGKQGGVD